MQRQRRRDLNLKINRVLDKRSSRGMIYENEELRLRTMAIADDVDRGQNDIKKLRKENDHLKREIWSLRDECEKLEEILKKVVAAGGVPLDPDDLPYPELFMDDNTSFDEGEDSTEDDEHMALMRNMFMIDEDQISNTGSVVDVDLPSTSVSNVNHFENSSPKNQNSPEILSDTQNQQKFVGMYHSHPWGPAAIPPDLEAVREETESIVTSVTSVNNTLTNSPIDPVDQYSPSFDESGNNINSLSATHSHYNPLIEITPASSPASIPMDPDAPQSPMTVANSPEGGGDIHDGGCVAVIPKMFQVTSQIQFDNSADNNEALTSKGSNKPPINSKITSRRKFLPKDSESSTSTYSSGSTSSRPHSVSGDQPSKECEAVDKNQSMSMSRKMYLSNRRNSQIISTSTSKNPFSNSIAFIANRCCPNLHGCYQSDPSSLATSTGERDERFNSGHNMTLDTPNCYPCCNNTSYKSSWNSIIDTNLVVGYFAPNPSGTTFTMNNIKPQDIIDELEVKVDSSLEKVKGIRMLPGRVFISFRDPTCVKYLLKKFGDNSSTNSNTSQDEVQKQFIVKGQRIVFLEGGEKYSEISLSGIPPDISDLLVTSVLNQYGQVVSPLERRGYKGVDISERFAKMHLVKSLPNVLTISGYDVSVSVVPKNAKTPTDVHRHHSDDEECQDEHIQHPLASLAFVPSVSSSVSVSSPYVNVTPQKNSHDVDSVETTHRPPVNPAISGCKDIVTCHTSPVMSTSISGHIPTGNTNSLTPILINVPTPSTISTPPAQTDGLKPHKQVIRSTSSNPRLESAPVPLSPIVTKRQSSVCGANIRPEEHPSKITAPGQQVNQKSLKVNGGTNSAPNLLPNPKRPLSRLLRSSPGSLVPPAGAKVVEPIISINDIGTPQVQGAVGSAAALNASGLRAAFYKSLSIDPRRGSIVSNAGVGENNNVDKLGIYSRRGSHNVPQGRRLSQGQHGHPGLQQMNSYSSSQFESRDSIVKGFGGSGPKEPLPWCGCWGNGCI